MIRHQPSMSKKPYSAAKASVSQVPFDHPYPVLNNKLPTCSHSKAQLHVIFIGWCLHVAFDKHFSSINLIVFHLNALNLELCCT